jgi:hypothetical protein
MRLKSPTEATLSVCLTNGHGIRIGPEGRDVPEMFRRDALAAGAIPAEMSAADFETNEPPPPDDSKAALLINGIKQILTENNPDDFTGSGLPNRKKLSAMVGWNVSAEELGAAWKVLQGDAATGEPE